MTKVTNQLIKNEITKRGFRFIEYDDYRNTVCFIDDQSNPHYLRSCLSQKTSVLNSSMTKNKHLMTQIAESNDIRIPETSIRCV